MPRTRTKRNFVGSSGMGDGVAVCHFNAMCGPTRHSETLRYGLAEVLLPLIRAGRWMPLFVFNVGAYALAQYMYAECYRLDVRRDGPMSEWMHETETFGLAYLMSGMICLGCFAVSAPLSALLRGAIASITIVAVSVSDRMAWAYVFQSEVDLNLNLHLYSLLVLIAILALLPLKMVSGFSVAMRGQCFLHRQQTRHISIRQLLFWICGCCAAAVLLANPEYNNSIGYVAVVAVAAYSLVSIVLMAAVLGDRRVQQWSRTIGLVMLVIIWCAGVMLVPQVSGLHVDPIVDGLLWHLGIITPVLIAAISYRVLGYRCRFGPHSLKQRTTLQSLPTTKV